ncbi:MAG: hypothetical protein J6Z03_01790 [Erysipelotrichaceae bacterium]|nr:hypothetical protein [Erysipelotrichaceae bacterium]
MKRKKTELQFKEGIGWKACFDGERDYYSAESGGTMAYDLYEIDKDLYDQLDENMTESEADMIISQGRHLYMSVDDRCGPPYDVAFDSDYAKLCPWAKVMKSGHQWSKELTDAAVEIFESERKNREHRKKKKETDD